MSPCIESNTNPPPKEWPFLTSAEHEAVCPLPPNSKSVTCELMPPTSHFKPGLLSSVLEPSI